MWNRDERWKDALRAVEERLEARLRELENARVAERVERAEWAERLERLYHRIRMLVRRSEKAEETPDQKEDTISPLALRRSLGK